MKRCGSVAECNADRRDASLWKGGAQRVYAWVWRHLPGALWVRALWALIIFAIIVFVLFQYVFPWIEPYLPFSGNGSLSE